MNTTEESQHKPETTEVERPREQQTDLSGVNPESSRAAALLTQQIIDRDLSSVQEQQPASETIVAELLKTISAELTTLSKKRLQEKLQQQTELIEDFIQFGREELNEQFAAVERDPTKSEAEKEHERAELLQTYVDSKFAQKIAGMKAVRYLLDNLLNQYTTLEQASTFTNSGKDDQGKWFSNFNPEQVQTGLSRLISQEVLEEMRTGIQVGLEMREQIETKLNTYRQADRRIDAARLVREEFGFEPVGRIKVKEGPISITLIIDDDRDYEQIYSTPEKAKLSGGFHKRLVDKNSSLYGDQSAHPGISHSGIFNVARRYGSSDTVIAHENEHSLNEILMHTRGKREGQLERTLESLSKSGDKNEPVSPEKTKTIGSLVEKMMADAQDRLFSGFADEVLAYMLTDQHIGASAFEAEEKYFNKLAKNELYNRYAITDELVEKVTGELTEAVANIEETHRKNEDNPDFPIFAQKVKDIIKLKVTKSGIERNLYKPMIRAVYNLKTAKLPDNFIRAVLAGENPAKWLDISKKTLAYHQDKQDIPTEHKSEKEAKTLKKQITTAEVLLREMFKEDVQEGTVVHEGSESKQEETENITPIARIQDKVRSPNHKDILFLTEPKFSSKQPAQMYGGNGEYMFALRDYMPNIKAITDNGTYILINEQVVNRQGDIVLRSEDGTRGDKSDFIESNGRCALLVTHTESRKKYIKIEGGGQCGVEFENIKKVTDFNGTIVYAAEQKNGNWVLADEQGNILSSEHYSIENIKTTGTHVWLKVTGPDQSVSIVNEQGDVLDMGGEVMPNKTDYMDFRSFEIEGRSILKVGNTIFSEEGTPILNEVSQLHFVGTQAYAEKRQEQGAFLCTLDGKPKLGPYSKLEVMPQTETLICKVTDAEGNVAFVDEQGKNIVTPPAGWESYEFGQLISMGGDFRVEIENKETNESAIIDIHGNFITGPIKDAAVFDDNVPLIRKVVKLSHSQNEYAVLNKDGQQISQTYKRILHIGESNEQGRYFVLGETEAGDVREWIYPEKNTE